MKRRVVVTGLGVVTSLGVTIDKLWRRICAGESGIRPFSFDSSDFPVHFGGEIVDWTFDCLPDKEARRLDRYSQFAVACAVDAMIDAGIDMSVEDPYRGGVIIGTGIGGLLETEAQHTRLVKRGVSKVSPFTIPKMIPNAASGQIAIHLGLKGVNTAVSTACASATNSLGDAMKMIECGMADFMVSGGSEATITPMALAGFCRMKALSLRNDDPTHASRPFDVDRDGFVLSEGAGVLVLEEYERAKARGASIYAELVGYGATADATHITQPDEQGSGAAHAIQMALDDAQLNPEEVDYINAHGTSTPLGDRAETTSLKRVFGDHARKVNISSTKSQLGHLLGASGGVELILSIFALNNGIVPPTINLENPDPDCDLDYTPNKAREFDGKVALSNSFGFGGHNACLVIRKI
jgi:3-oxoacyl-[acyl-carrier-protein] synthase II